MVVSIKGIKFNIVLLSKGDYIKSHTDESLAHLDTETRNLIFREDKVKKNIVVHEVTHAFIHGCHLGSCNDLSIEDFEEIICEMMEDHLLDIESTSKKILKHLEGK